MEEDNHQFLRRVVKSLLATVAMVILSMWGIYSLVSLAFTNMSVEQSNTWIIISMCIGTIFTILLCTFSILDELKRKY